MGIKTIMVSLILGLGISAGVYLLSHQPYYQTPESDLYPKISNSQITQKPFVENLPTNSSETANAASPNLTETLFNKIGQKILDQNPNGPVNVNGEPSLNAPDAATLAQEMLQEATTKFNPESLTQTIDKSRILVSSGNSKEELIKYFNDFNQIMQNQSQYLVKKLGDGANNLSLENLPDFINAYQNTVENFYKTSVPSKALSLHEEEIKLLETELNILKTMAGYGQDPVVAILAADQLPSLDEKFQELQKNLNKFIEENGLNK